MAHYCHICGRYRSNEKFTGKGHRDHICKDCQHLPHEQRDFIECTDELYGYLTQSHISAGNIRRLEILTQHPSNEVKELAILLLDVARVKPYKRRRLKFLAAKYPDLFRRLKALWSEDAIDEDFGQDTES